MAKFKEYQDKKLETKNAPAPTLLTQDEYRALLRADKRDRINQILRGAGIIFIIILYLVMAEFLFEISIFGAIFPNTRDEHVYFWKFVTTDIADVIIPDVETKLTPSGRIFDDWWQMGPLLPKLGLSIVLVLATVGIGFLIAYSISDIIGIIKNMFIVTHKTVKDIGEIAQEGISEELGTEVVPRKKTKKLFEDTPDDPKEQVKVKQPKQSRAEKKAAKTEALNNEVDALLDQLLTHPHTAAEEKIISDTFGSESTGQRIDN